MALAMLLLMLFDSRYVESAQNKRRQKKWMEKVIILFSSSFTHLVRLVEFAVSSDTMWMHALMGRWLDENYQIEKCGPIALGVNEPNSTTLTNDIRFVFCIRSRLIFNIPNSAISQFPFVHSECNRIYFSVCRNFFGSSSVYCSLLHIISLVFLIIYSIRTRLHPRHVSHLLLLSNALTHTHTFVRLLAFDVELIENKH